MNEFRDWISLALGLHLQSMEISVPQMALRAVIVYIVTVLIVRLGKKRFMGRASAFDVILGIMLGSIVSRAVTGNAPLGAALAAAAVLLILHALFSRLALDWHGFGKLIKGEPILMIRDGRLDRAAMRAAHMTERDLWEDLRSDGIKSLEQVAEARLERNGRLSIIRAPAKPTIVEVTVEHGVQKVVLELR